ncbi:Uncharacterised protein [Mycobacteroides abscessus subsp. abscessus]|nr:Uncharacterised protein [Mycobacteroides abscessus subsp. abscessus]
MWIDRVGLGHHRRPQLAPRPVRPAGAGRRLGLRSVGAHLVVVCTDGCRPGCRRRVRRERVVGVVVGQWHRRLGVRRWPGHQGRQARRLRKLLNSARGLQHQGRLERGGAARHRLEHDRGQGRLRATASHAQLPHDGDGAGAGTRAQHRAGLQDALGDNPSQHHLDADRRYGIRGVRRACRTPGQACTCGLCG